MNEYSNINLLHCLATPIVKIKIAVTSEGSVERNKKTKRVRNSQNGQLVITSQSKKFPLIVQMSSMGPNNTHQFASQCLTHWAKWTLIPFLIWRTFNHSRRWEMIKEF